jgi:hypothetical protein
MQSFPKKKIWTVLKDMHDEEPAERCPESRKCQKTKMELGLEAQAYNPSTEKAEEGGS